MMTTDALLQQFDLARKHLMALQQQTPAFPGQPEAPNPTLQGLAANLLALQQGFDDLIRQNEACMARCREWEAGHAFYQSIFEFTPHARLLTDLDGIIQSANAPALDLLGVAEGSLIGQPLSLFLAVPDQQGLGQQLERLRSGENLMDWTVGLLAGGAIVPASLDAVPIYSTERRVMGLQWLLRDISRQAATEEPLRRSEHLLRSFMEQWRDGVALTDEQGTVVEWNQAMEQITGLYAVEACGRPIWDVQFELGSEAERTPAARERLRSGLQELLRSGQAPWLGRVLEREQARRDGSVRVLQGVVFPIRSNRGFMLGSVTRDVTDRRRAEEERERLLAENRAQREFLERLVESAPVGIAVLRGADHRYELANPYYRSPDRCARQADNRAHDRRGHSRPGEPADARAHGRGVSQRPNGQHPGSRAHNRPRPRADLLGYRPGTSSEP